MKKTKNRNYKKNRTKNMKRIKSKKGLYKKNRTKKIGGELRGDCNGRPEKFPKCGAEGCVYLDSPNIVTKKQWKTNSQMNNHLLSIEGQDNSKPYSPKIISTNIKPCNLISKYGNENNAPCFVKRYRNTRNGNKILYEEESRDSWCRNYGVKEQCVVDEKMYNKFKNDVTKLSFDGNPGRSVALPDFDSMSDGDGADSLNDEDLGDLYDKIEIDESFTNVNPIFLTDITMDRIKGITILELLQEMGKKLGYEKTLSVSPFWEDEKNDLIQKIMNFGYTSSDFNEQNIMIDIDDEILCSWIDSKLAEKIPITPEMIKQDFKKEHILKIIDWGLLKKVQK